MIGLLRTVYQWCRRPFCGHELVIVRQGCAHCFDCGVRLPDYDSMKDGAFLV